MKYGSRNIATHKVQTPFGGFGSRRFQPMIEWVRAHPSGGTFHYQRLHADSGVSWSFSKSEDAVLFTLRFK